MVELRGWQKEAFNKVKEALVNDKNILIVAPTGAGKSYIVYKLIEKLLKYNITPIVYTTPFRVLTYQKANEMRKIFGIKPRIETGEYKDIKINSPIIVATQEIYKDKYQNISKLTIIDEFHIIGDAPERALAYLETLHNHPIVALSATIKITDSFKKYLEKISNREWEIIEYDDTNIGNKIKLHDELLDIDDVVKIIKKSNHITAIVGFNRKILHSVMEIFGNILDRLPDNKIKEIEKILGMNIEFVTQKFDSLKYLDKGIVLIHSKVPTIVKRIAITLAEKNLIKLIIGTDSFTTGTNFPIENLIFIQTHKYDGNTVRLLTEKEFIQIVGRAGRQIGNVQIDGHIYFADIGDRYAYTNYKGYLQLIEEYKAYNIREIEIKIKLSVKDIFKYAIEGKDIYDLIGEYKEKAIKYSYPEIFEHEIEDHIEKIEKLYKYLKEYIEEKEEYNKNYRKLLRYVIDIIPDELWGNIDSSIKNIKFNIRPKPLKIADSIIEYGFIKDYTEYIESDFQNKETIINDLIPILKINLNILKDKAWLETRDINEEQIIEKCEEMIEKIKKYDEQTYLYWKDILDNLKDKYNIVSIL